MSTDTDKGRVIKFDEFTFDSQSGELRKGEELVKLHPQPTQLLKMLIVHAGQMVTRNEMQKEIWDEETTVDFELGINSCICQIRIALNDDSHKPRYIETLPGKGYRFIAPVSRQSPDPAEKQPQNHIWRQPVRYALGVLATVIVLALVVGLNLRGHRDLLVGGTKSIESLAVLPLVNLSGDPEQEYFADGMTEALITDLAKIEALRVISSLSAMKFKGSDTSLPEIAQALNVDALVEGSVLRSGDQVRITIQLIQADPEKHLWAKNYEGDLRDVLSLQNDISRSVAREIRIAVTPQEEARLAGVTRSVNPDAHVAYLRGRHFWNMRSEEGNSRAMELFLQAIEIDPSYALAYAGLADSYLFSSQLSSKESSREARAALRRALEIDDTLGEAHATLAFIDTFDYKWEDAERGFQWALELSPSYATAHHWYGFHLAWTGRHEEAIAELRLARELDPLSPIIDSALGGVLYYSGQYDRAIKHHQRFLRLDETFLPARVSLALNYLQKSRFEEALTELRTVVDSDPTPSRLVHLAYAYAVAGERAEAEKNLARLIADYLLDEESYHLARIYVALGQREKAFQWLEVAYEHDPNVVLLKVDPALEPLRPDPRFQDLLRRMNFPE